MGLEMEQIQKYSDTHLHYTPGIKMWLDMHLEWSDLAFLHYMQLKTYMGEIFCVSIQGLHPSKDPAFVVFEGKSFQETLLTASTVVKRDV